MDNTANEIDLLLKVQGTSADWAQGAIEVLYDPRANGGAGAVQIETYRPAAGWTTYAPTALKYQSGDRFGARALANGTVEVYKNCVLVSTVTLNPADQTFFNPKGGRIGMWFIGGASAFFDDVGGA